jgi:tRNA A-37 threonylcarbamoyl transferase component Bud32
MSFSSLQVQGSEMNRPQTPAFQRSTLRFPHSLCRKSTNRRWSLFRPEFGVAVPQISQFYMRIATLVMWFVSGDVLHIVYVRSVLLQTVNERNRREYLSSQVERLTAR